MKTRILTIVAAAAMGVMSLSAAGTCEIKMDNIIDKPGKTVMEPVYLDNSGEVQGFQCDILASEGVTIDIDDIEAAERLDEHDLRATRLDNGAILVTAINLNAQPIAGNEGPLFSIPVTLPEEEGTYELTLSYVVLSVKGEGRVQLPDYTAVISVDKMTGIDGIEHTETTIEWYDLNGHRITNPGGGIYIRRQGGTATKELLKK